MKKTKRAFTLIELLVVVLIIGILTAVALPQYEAAVAKSRFSALIPIVDGYKKSLDMYYLANGEYPPDTCDEMSCGNGIEYDVLDYGVPNVLGLNHNTGNAYVVWANISDHPNERRCLATATNKIANQVCKSFGGEEVTGENYQYATLNLGTLKVYKF